MSIRLSLRLARRLRLTKGGGRSTRAGVAVGVTGVAIALAVMTISVAVVTGFKSAIESKVCGLHSDIVITSPEGGWVALTPSLRSAIEQAAPGAGIAVATDLTGILKTPTDFQGLMFRGLNPQADTAFISSALTAGALGPVINPADADAPRLIAIGEPTATALGLALGDRVDALFVLDEAIRARRFTVGAIFDTNFSTFDASTVLVAASSLPLEQPPFADPAGTSIRITGPGRTGAQQAAAAIYDAAIADYAAGTAPSVPLLTTVEQTGEFYFNWLALLDTNVVVILILMAVVSSFTLISSLFVLILRRVAMIGTLKALGATDALVGNIFAAMALRVTLIGMAIGNVIALTLLSLQDALHFIRLDPVNYYVSYVPVSLSPAPILAINAGVFILSLLIVLGPSRLVMTVKPAATMRYE